MHSLLEKHEGTPMKDHTISEEGIAAQKHVDKDHHEAVDGGHESRLLTKNQISDMAFGIRELAKKLAQLRIKLNVKNVFILTKAHDESLIENTRDATEWLLGNNQSYKVFVLISPFSEPG